MKSVRLFSLRNIRRLIALPFFLLLVFIFIDFNYTLSSSWIKGLIYIQFAPSIIQFFLMGGLLATGFLLVLLLTLLFGRVYCSTLCPLGVFQDSVSRVRPKRPRFKYMKPWNWVRYTLLVAVVVTVASGWLFLLNILEPYSLFGRIVSNFIRPTYIWLNNQGVQLLSHFNSYLLHEVNFISVPWPSLVLTALVGLLVIVLSWRYGRLYCNTLCPVGSLLGLVSKVSLFQLKIDESACTSCQRCVRSCKASCIDTSIKQIDFSRCVACYNCIESCSERGIGYKLAWKSGAHPEPAQESRRNFLATALGIFAASAWFNPIRALAIDPTNKFTSKAGTLSNKRTAPITPPGSYSYSRFASACTACHLCVSVCPTKVIQPSVTEYGLWGIMQPHMDFHAGFCNFECVKCGDVCPTGAIAPLDLETKKRTQVGIAYFHRENCIVHVDKTECGACSEHCPTKAVYMVPYHGLYMPEVRDDLCIGCGACEFACPTYPYRAIFVNGNREHAIATLPESTDEKPRKSTLEEFPF